MRAGIHFVVGEEGSLGHSFLMSARASVGSRRRRFSFVILLSCFCHSFGWGHSLHVPSIPSSLLCQTQTHAMQTCPRRFPATGVASSVPSFPSSTNLHSACVETELSQIAELLNYPYCHSPAPVSQTTSSCATSLGEKKRQPHLGYLCKIQCSGFLRAGPYLPA